MRSPLVPVVVVLQGVFTVAAPAWGQAGPALIAAPPRPLQTDAPAGGAGLFVGVNRFSDPSGAVSDLRYAVNDAVGLAHLFALELDLIPAKNCTLALSGEPDGERSAAELKALTAAGAQVTGATKSEILDGLFRACDAAAQAAGPAAGQAAAENAAARAPLVVSLSSHGFDDAGTPFVMPSDGRRRRLGVTALPLSIVEDEAGRSRAGHRLLLVDACQERIGGTKAAGGAGTVAAMTPAFAAALAQPTGQVKIASCAAGQFSVEVPALRHGVFTKAFLDCLRGAAGDRDGDGVISLGDVEPVMEARVKALIADYNQGLPEGRRIEQSPAFYGPLAARRLPLAVPATDVAALIAQLAAQTSPDGYPPALHDRVAAALQGQADPRLYRAAEQFAAGGDAFTFRAVAEALLTGRKVVTVAADGSGDVRTVAEALAKVADDGRVRILPGVYREEPLVIDRPITLEGVGPREQIEITCATGDVLTITADGATVKGLTATCLTPAKVDVAQDRMESYNAFYIPAGRPTLEDCLCRSDFGDAINVTGAGTAPTLRGCAVAGGGGSGLSLSAGAAGVYQNCVFTKIKWVGIHVQDPATAPAVTDCTVEDGGGNGLYILGGAAGTYQGCVFRRHKDPGIAVNGTGTVPTVKDCTVEDGVGSGLYVIAGAAGLYEGCNFRRHGGPAVAVEGAGTAPTVRNCTAADGQGSGLDIYAGAAGLYERCAFEGNKSGGVNAFGAGTNPTVTHCTGKGVGDNGLCVADGASGAYRDCTFTGNGTVGILVKGSGTAPTMTRCAAVNGETSGLYITAGAAGVYQNCTLTGNKQAGVAVTGAGTNPTLKNCTAADGQNSGLYIYDGAAGVFEGCAFKDNQYAGVTFKDAGTRATLRRCTITGNGYQALWGQAGAVATVENCDLSGNARGATYLEEGATYLEEGASPLGRNSSIPRFLSPAPSDSPAPPAPFFPDSSTLPAFPAPPEILDPPAPAPPPEILDPPAPAPPPEILDPPAPAPPPEFLDPPAPPAPPGGG